jgi:DNA-directed RNA polymerase subunit RPC12/RpoP
MDVIFNCPKCEQELAVDSSGAGSEIACPSCGESILIPESAGVPHAGIPTLAPDEAAANVPHLRASAISSSAAAKVEMHLRVPSNKAAEMLIAMPLAPLEVAAKESDRKMRVKTIKHTDCIEVGHDKFDEFVTNFLIKIGETNIISINTLTYTHLDIGSQKLMTDFGVMIVYRG